MPPTHPSSLAPAASPTVPAASAHHSGVLLSEVLAALSYALDLTDGQPPGHTLRTCIVGLRLADELALPPASRSALYYALLLKDAGCSSNAARMAALFGSDDQLVKPRMRVVEHARPLLAAVQLARNVAVGGSWLARVRQFLHVATAPEAAREMILIRCDRGAEIARRLGFPDETADAIRSLDEHWSGQGYPDGLRGDAIPLLSRIALLAQTVEVFFTERGVDAALDVARARRGRWFDPRLVDRVLAWRRDSTWWAQLRAPELLPIVVGAEPHRATAPAADADRLDVVARAFADVIDAKSPYTFRHSTNVAALARGAARLLGLSAEDGRRLHQAGLLHDIGKLGVSNLILDKPGRLTPEERAAVERHPLYTWDVLSRVGAFAGIARPASMHHEKLDGSGYPWGVRGDELDVFARLLVVADIYEAMTADRPYRAGMTPHAAVALLHRDRGTKLCPQAIDALAAFAEESDGWFTTHPVAMQAA